MSILPDGPAFEAGIRRGDVIAKIDGVRSQKLFLPDVRSEFMDELKKEIQLIIDRPEKRGILHKLKLRDLY